MLSVKQEAVNTNFTVIGLIRLGIKPKPTAPEADALTTRPSERFKSYLRKTVVNQERYYYLHSRVSMILKDGSER